MGENILNFILDFIKFIKQYQVIGLAVAVIIGAAATKFITATVNDVIMPLISVFIPGGDWRKMVLDVGPAKILFGDFLGALIDFLIILFYINISPIMEKT